jgi:hypothetical protein
MPDWKAGLASVWIVATVFGVASAQDSAKMTTSGKNAGYPDAGSLGYDRDNTLIGGFGNDGIYGSYPRSGADAFFGYGPGPALNRYFVVAPPSQTPAIRKSSPTSNNLNGLVGAIRRQVNDPGKPGSGSSKGTTRPRKGR